MGRNGVEKNGGIGGRGGHFSEYNFINHSDFWNHVNVLHMQGKRKGRREGKEEGTRGNRREKKEGKGKGRKKRKGQGRRKINDRDKVT